MSEPSSEVLPRSVRDVIRDGSARIAGTRVTRWAYPAAMRRAPVHHPIVVATTAWIADRLAAHGFAEPGGAWWCPAARELVRNVGQAQALHGALCDLVARARSIDMHEGTSLDDHHVRWALNRKIDGIVRCLTKTRAPLDGAVFTHIVEWDGWQGAGPVEWYLTYAPMRTLRSIEPWLYDAVTRDGLPVHERALLMRPLARLDSAAAVAVARMLLDESPWASAELLGMHGGYADLEFLDSRLSHYRQRGFAEDRRKLEAAIRKIGRRLVRAGT